MTGWRRRFIIDSALHKERKKKEDYVNRTNCHFSRHTHSIENNVTVNLDVLSTLPYGLVSKGKTIYLFDCDKPVTCKQKLIRTLFESLMFTCHSRARLQLRIIKTMSSVVSHNKLER